MKVLLLASAFLFTSVTQGKIMSQMEKIKYAFTNLNGQNIELLNDFYDESVHFQDPLGTHKGRDSVKAYYTQLYKNVTFIKFAYTNTISDGNKHLLIWTMSLKAKGLNSGKLVTLDGNSVIVFNNNNLVIYHRDYFDMGEFIYEHVPVLGWAVKKVKKKLKN